MWHGSLPTEIGAKTGRTKALDENGIPVPRLWPKRWQWKLWADCTERHLAVNAIQYRLPAESQRAAWEKKQALVTLGEMLRQAEKEMEARHERLKKGEIAPIKRKGSTASLAKHASAGSV